MGLHDSQSIFFPVLFASNFAWIDTLGLLVFFKAGSLWISVCGRDTSYGWAVIFKHSKRNQKTHCEVMGKRLASQLGSMKSTWFVKLGGFLLISDAEMQKTLSACGPYQYNAAVLNDNIRSSGPAQETSLHLSIYSESVKLVFILMCTCVCHVLLWLIPCCEF